jgi:2-polyprenyl-6-methoxyphenol hydroxylase-like FAD-dependent oxidoreductase
MRGAPIAEYLPKRLARGPLAILGDAAHVLSPMTGSGYATAVEDAITLSDMLSHADRTEPLSD